MIQPRSIVAFVVLAIGGVAQAISLLTYREPVDGDYVPFVVSAVLGITGTLLVVVWCLARRIPAWLALLLALPLLLPAPVVHGVRLWHQGTVFQVQLGSGLVLGGLIEPALRGEAMLRLGEQPDELLLRVPSESIGYLEMRYASGGLTDWYLRRALLTAQEGHVGEEIQWEAHVTLDRTYFVLVDTGELLVQLTGWGALVTVAGADGKPEAHGVPLPFKTQAWHQWSLRRTAGHLLLRMDQQGVWTMADPGPFQFVRLGETRTDREHGGTLRLRYLQFTRFLE